MSPDEKFEEKRTQEEAERLKGHVEKLKEEDRQRIYQKGKNTCTVTCYMYLDKFVFGYIFNIKPNIFSKRRSLLISAFIFFR